MTEKLGEKGFLLVKRAYRVRCRNCGFAGKAAVGKDFDSDRPSEDWCPVCGCLALIPEAQWRHEQEAVK